MGSSDTKLDVGHDDVTTDLGLRRYRKLARRTGLVECYAVQLISYGGCLDPGGVVRVRANRYSRRATIKAEILNKAQDTPEVKRRFLIGSEWHRVIEWVEDAGFWKLPSIHHPSSCGFHGATWTIEGFRDGRFHYVRRNTWSLMDDEGAEVFRLGDLIAGLVGFSGFEGTEK